MQGSEKSRGATASVVEFLLTIAIAIVAMVYLSLMAYTKDGLWFWPVFNAQPGSVMIYCYGNQVSLDGNSQETKDLAELLNEQLSGDKRWDELNLTNETFADYVGNPELLVVEFLYSEGQRIHSPSPFFSGFTSLLLPLDARHADTNIIFSLINGKPAGGSFHLESTQPIRDYLAQANLCNKP